jgi:hypothetical protein
MAHSRFELKVTIPALLIALVLVAAACSFGDDDDSAPAIAAPGEPARDFDDGDFGTGGEAEEPAAPPGATPEPADAADPLGSGGLSAVALQSVDLGRDIIFRADLTVAVNDVSTAGAEATSIIEGLGGFVFGQQSSGRPDPRSTITFKIAPESFQAALTALGEIGELRSQNVSADDVTERVVDIQSRISTAEASVTRLRAFLEEADDITTIAEIERELLNRETTLETLRGQLRTLQDQVALATIVLNLTTADISPAVELFVSTYLGDDDNGESCPGEEDPEFIEGDEVTICFEIFNEGDTSLTDLTLTDTVLDVELADLIVVAGDMATLESGASLVLAYETTVDRNVRTRTRVSAEPVNSETGAVVEGRTVSTTRSGFISVRDPGGLPGFGDALSGSWNVLQDAGQIAVLVIAAAIPFSWILVLLAAWWLISRRRKVEDADTAASAVEGGGESGGETL